MKVTDAILGEHGVFYEQFDHLEEVLAAALVPHAELENEFLIEAMEIAAGGAPGPAAAMREEHEEIESRLEGARTGSDTGRAKAALLEAIRLSRIHFEREGRVAFPLAESVLED